MAWNRIIGQSRVKDLLQHAIAGGEIAHAYLFHGQQGVGKDALALEFARAILCERRGTEACGECASCRKTATLQHPDLKFICPLPVAKNEQAGDDPVALLKADEIALIKDELAAKAEDPYHVIEIPRATNIKINSVRSIKREASLSAFDSSRKCFIISGVETMNQASSTALLKTLEEPPEDCVLLLTTSQKEMLLPTILSRCQLVHCEPLGDEELRTALIERGVDTGRAALAAKLANGSYTAARGLTTDDIDAERKQTTHFLRVCLQRKPATLSALIDEIIENRDRPALERWLRLCLAWLRDALLIQQGVEPVFANDEHKKDLTSFTSNFRGADILTAMQRVESAIRMVGQNAHVPLVFIWLALELRKSIVQQA